MARNKASKASSKTARAVGKGFYIALALCVLAVGGMAVSTFTDTMRTEESSTVFTTAPPTVVTSVSPAVVTPATTTTRSTTTMTSAATTTAPPPSVVWPMGQETAAVFSETPIYSETMADYRPHLGVDLVGDDGQTVSAAMAGTVSAVDEDALWGGSVSVDHGNGSVTVYRGVDPTVQEGDTVKTGDPIGVLIGVPCEKGATLHLHWELLRNGQASDPLAWLKANE